MAEMAWSVAALIHGAGRIVIILAQKNKVWANTSLRLNKHDRRDCLYANNNAAWVKQQVLSKLQR